MSIKSHSSRKVTLLLLFIIVCSYASFAQIDPNSCIDLPTVTTTQPRCINDAGIITVNSLDAGTTYTLTNTSSLSNEQHTAIAGETQFSSQPLPLGTYTIIATSSDGCSSQAVVVTLQSPTVNLIISCPISITLECGENTDTLNTGSPILNSDCGTVTFIYTDSDLVGGCNEKTGSFTRTFTVTDEFGNTEICEQRISIEDTTAPQFVDQKLEELFTSCDAIPKAIAPAAIDDCDVNISVLFRETKIEGECDSKYTLERNWKATDVCGNENSFTQIIYVACPISVYNGLSIDNDGINDKLYLEGIECYPENNVKIFNRWGVLVFEKDNYNNGNNDFRGISKGRLTLERKEKLATGVYFYIINYKFTAKENPETLQQSGYLYIN
jgi:hypothetical protein